LISVWWDPLNVLPRGRGLIWLTLAVGVSFLQGPSFLESFRPAPDEGVDFFQEWSSAKSFFDKKSIYSRHSETVPKYLGFAVKHEPHRDAIQIKVDVNAHPPPSVFLALPFSRLDYPNAVLAWNSISIVMLVVSLRWLVRKLAIPCRAWSVFPAITILLLSNPLRQQVNQGQLGSLFLLLLLSNWMASRS